MREPELKEIDGVTYVVTPLGASKGIALTLRLGRVLGPTLAELTKLAGQKADTVRGRGLDILGKAAAELLERATEAELRAIYQPLAEETRVRREDGKAPKLSEVFDVHFAGRLDSFARWLAFALEVNVGPLAAMLGSARQLPGGDGAKAS